MNLKRKAESEGSSTRAREKEEVEGGEPPAWVRFESGFTYTSLIAVIYAIVVFIPALIYLTLMTGGVAGIPVAWFTLLLWVELGKLSGRRITKQEAFMILIITGAEMFIPLGMVYNAWYRASPIAKMFDIGRYVPEWVAPAEETGILELRTFLHPAWVLPLSVSLASVLIFGMLRFGLGLFAREAFIEVERLPFPLQQVSASALTVITGREKRPLEVLAVFSLVGFGYGFLLYAFPYVLQSYTGRYVQFIPIPWVDLNAHVEPSFPGACLGIATDLGPIVSGFVLPFSTVIGIFIGSFSIWFFGNWLSVRYNLVDIDPIKPGPQSWWVPGMSIQLAWQRSLLYFWATITIGALLAVGIAPILRRPRFFKDAFSSLLGVRRKGRGRHIEPIDLTRVTLPLMLVGLVGGMALFVALVPDFVLSNLWILILMIIIPFVTTIVGARTIGEAGVTPPGAFINNIQNILYYVSGYQGVDVWFAPNMMNQQGYGYLSWFKIAELTETKSKSIIKMYWLLLPIAILVGYAYVQMFWAMAPIPSGRYPGATIYWDIQATMQSLWIKGRTVPGLFRTERIPYALIAGIGLYFLLDLLHCPVSYVALGAGISMITPVAVTMLVGAIMAKIIAQIQGKEWWNKHKLIVAAGLLVGEGLSVIIAVSVALIINSIWALPW